jgi:hypothetical protein
VWNNDQLTSGEFELFQKCMFYGGATKTWDDQSMNNKKTVHDSDYHEKMATQ